MLPLQPSSTVSIRIKLDAILAAMRGTPTTIGTHASASVHSSAMTVLLELLDRFGEAIPLAVAGAKALPSVLPPISGMRRPVVASAIKSAVPRGTLRMLPPADALRSAS